MGARRSYVQPTSGPDKDLGAAFRHFRKTRRMTQERLAREAGFGRTYIGLVESGVISPRWCNIVRLAAALKVPPVEIVQLATEPRQEPPGDGQ